MAMGGKLQSKTQAAPPINRVSLSPDTFTSGGGLLEDVDVVIKDAAFLKWDYNGKAAEVPALGVTFRILGEENDPDETKDHDQYYSCGKLTDFEPTPDGSGLQVVGAKSSLNNSSNGGLFIASLCNVGVPKTMFESGDIKAIVGLRLHVNRVPAPEGRTSSDPNKKLEILVATKLLALPGEGGGVAGPVGTTKVPGISKVNGDAVANGLDSDIQGVLLEMLASGPLAKKQIGPKLFAAFKGDHRQAAAMRRGSSDDFLNEFAGTGVVTYDGATLTLAG